MTSLTSLFSLLLQLSNTQQNLLVREDLRKGVYIEGLAEEIVRNSEETISLLLRGMRNRHVGSTNMNFESSRSHSVFTMTIESKRSIEGIITVKVSSREDSNRGRLRQIQHASCLVSVDSNSNSNKMGRMCAHCRQKSTALSLHSFNYLLCAAALILACDFYLIIRHRSCTS